jgi:multiple sugar transport system permease protein
VFVLYNYMLTIPIELTEAAIVDGASVWRQYWQVILPVTRPALGALATLEFTWMYNDFLWALVLMSTGDKYPVTSSLNNIRGTFFVDFNLLAAGAVIVALPTMIVFFALQRQFISGLTLGASKG